MKEYKSPKLIAKNAPAGSYAAGCNVSKPYSDHSAASACKYCECRQ
ncbi:MAG: hypothetical protein J1E95_07090 [Muribaculaceae bacterium]|nr:hypothetical protein [Muribaculaceae bacterium]